MRPVGSKYLLEEPLGRGATGTVWRAHVRESGDAAASRPGETVAIKVLREELASDPDIVMRFLRERSVLLRLTHPNIVRVRDLVVEGDLLALVMDLVEGPDLHRYLRANGPFSPVAASLLTAQIADALAASHADEVVHRDLKPANVLLLTDEAADGSLMHPLLTDFGIARLADSPGITRTSEFVGTPAYVAPESAEGRPQTSAVDIYGAGILLYELVTGRPPFSGDNPIAVLHQHLSEQPRRPSTVPEPLWTVMERCLRKKPEERPSAENLAAALRVVADGIGVHASPAQAEAAFAVAGLLTPDPSPAPVPGSGGGDSAFTQVLPNRSGAPDADPTQVLAPGGPNGGSNGGGNHADPTTVLPPVPNADPTRVMPPVAGGDTSQQPQGPHPWQSQMRAARDRNEQTQVQQHLDPGEDPLRRRPRRQAAPQAQPQRGPQAQQGYADPRQPQYQQPYQQQPAPGPPAPYAPPLQPQPRPAPQPQPQQRPAPEPRAPRPRREPRPRTRARIPGLGCLKGCLTVIVILTIIVWLAWTVGPLDDWVANGRNFWETSRDWIKNAYHWINELQNSGSPK
ncbi:serine/threonine-protein kinase [Wenjunlia tyrosinilytica]|uniref:non-specific serine/threonine protein kinase n=1 Tax=Wenjunlia tyrosinilytica TaxID=1544741 RepID=A0A917ZWA0_9ACTN|nr:serine/threonine-protein kinase [Wenjunlia tyrosinilytica]GGO97424.1 hypothetical protein GCM10012280_59210 [Wenjunlia tyrosinilytica]